MANIKQNLMQPTPSADDQERMRMCKFCVHGHISDLGYNHCWQSDVVTCDGCSPMGICSAFRDKREWKPYYIAHLTTEYRGNICWVKAVRNSPVKGKSRIFKYEIIDPVASPRLLSRLKSSLRHIFLPLQTLSLHIRWMSMKNGMPIVSAPAIRSLLKNRMQGIIMKPIGKKSLLRRL